MMSGNRNRQSGSGGSDQLDRVTQAVTVLNKRLKAQEQELARFRETASSGGSNKGMWLLNALVLIAALLAGGAALFIATQDDDDESGSVATVDTAQLSADLRATVLMDMTFAAPTPIAIDPTEAATETPLPTTTDEPTTVPPTDVPTDVPPTTTPTPTLSPPPGEWSVRAYNIDDQAAILVNGKMITYPRRGSSADPLDITELLQAGDNTVSFLAWNGGSGGTWGFSIFQDGENVWQNEGTSGAERAVMYNQTLIIDSAGAVQEAVMTPNETPPPGTWRMRIRDTSDAAFVVINGMPALSYVRDVYQGSWVDIGSYLSNAQVNTIDVQTWNHEGDARWQFDLMHNDTIIWGRTGSISGTPGRVFEGSVTISPDGAVQDLAAESDGAVEWSARAYDLDDRGAIFVNGQPINFAGYAGRGGDSGWINLDDHLVADQANQVTFGAWNGPSGGRWGFALRRNGVIVWGREGGTETENSQMTIQNLTIDESGDFAYIETPPLPAPTETPAWQIRAQNCNDACFISINGELVIAAIAGVFEPDWLDISGLVLPDEQNVIRIQSWNVDGDYNWAAAIQKDGAVVWENQQDGAGEPGIVFSAEVLIDESGQIQP